MLTSSPELRIVGHSQKFAEDDPIQITLFCIEYEYAARLS